MALIAPAATVALLLGALTVLAGLLDRTLPGLLTPGEHPLAAVSAWCGVGLAASLSALVAFMGSLTSRLAVVSENASRLSDHRPLQDIEVSGDEIGCLAAGLARTGRLLAERERELRAALEAEEQAHRAKTDFLSRVSHELRTPLHAVLGFSELLELETDLNTNEREAVDHILHASRHLLDLINELLDINRIESDLVAAKLESINVAEIFREALILVGPLADQHEVGLHCEGLSDWPEVHVTADHQRLLQVLLNLLSNAIKYNHPGGVVIGDCRPMGDQTRLRVTDNGRGIDLDEIDRLFSPFDRLGAETTMIEGSGIGLSLSQQLVASMHGIILVDSAPGVGSTFAVDLPSTAAVRHLPQTADTLAVPFLQESA